MRVIGTDQETVLGTKSSIILPFDFEQLRVLQKYRSELDEVIKNGTFGNVTKQRLEGEFREIGMKIYKARYASEFERQYEKFNKSA